VLIADTLAGAPDTVMEALAEILLSKLFRRPVPAIAMNATALPESPGRPTQPGPGPPAPRPQASRRRAGQVLRLKPDVRGTEFSLLPRADGASDPGLEPNASRTLLGHYDPSHNAIVLSRILDRPQTPRVAVEYVLFHEMLHLRFPAEHRGARRCVHTKAFKEAEKQFEN